MGGCFSEKYGALLLHSGEFLMQKPHPSVPMPPAPRVLQHPCVFSTPSAAVTHMLPAFLLPPAMPSLSHEKNVKSADDFLREQESEGRTSWESWGSLFSFYCVVSADR